MKCPKCGCENVNISMVNSKVKTNDTSLLRKMCRGFLILCTCGLWLLVPKRKANSKIKSKKTAICQGCGYSWNV